MTQPDRAERLWLLAVGREVEACSLPDAVVNSAAGTATSNPG